MKSRKDLISELKGLQTESKSDQYPGLDSLTTEQGIELFVQDYLDYLPVILTRKSILSTVILEAKNRIKSQSKIVYTGAGTSGRLGILDASECPPTFGVDSTVFVGIIAGGETAIRNAVEGAEDNEEMGIEDYSASGISVSDLLIGITASGRTPYVMSQLKHHHALGGKTVLIICNEKPEGSYPFVDYLIDLNVGKEILTGSTRLKSGTLTKIILNLISTLSMAQVGKIWGNYMVDLKATNEKLKARAVKTFIEITGESFETAESFLQKSDFQLKTALVMFYKSCGKDQAAMYISEADGQLKNLL
ncbi:MAG: N-acetylmuramic acid 6-phosphate etherase [Bacteroidetes bacterium]|nr:N-acetylmuramic acid 6-phosphate etherase [Bacteroidota bacterium]